MNKNLLILIVVAVVILGVVYYFSALPEDQIENENLSGDTPTETLEQELTNTDIDNLDREFADIDMELEAAILEAQ